MSLFCSVKIVCRLVYISVEKATLQLVQKASFAINRTLYGGRGRHLVVVLHILFHLDAYKVPDGWAGLYPDHP